MVVVVEEEEEAGSGGEAAIVCGVGDDEDDNGDEGESMRSPTNDVAFISFPVPLYAVDVDDWDDANGRSI